VLASSVIILAPLRVPRRQQFTLSDRREQVNPRSAPFPFVSAPHSFVVTMSSSSPTTTTTALETPRTTTLPVRRNRRRFSSYRSSPRRLLCHALPPTVDALDLSSAGVARPTLASLRVHVLEYLADLETRLTLLDSPLGELDFDFNLDSYIESAKNHGEVKVQEARKWARSGLERVARIRSDVCSYLPEFPDFEEFGSASVANVKSHLPEAPLAALSLEDVRSRLPDMPRVGSLSLEDMRSHLPDMPQLPDIQMPQMSDFDFNLSNLRSRLESLSVHIDSLQTHMSAAAHHLPNLQSGFHGLDMSMISLAPSSVLSDLLDRVLMSDHLYKMLPKDNEKEESVLEKAARELATAVKCSMNGAQLICYSDLPQKWRNNPFVTTGYRYAFLVFIDWVGAEREVRSFIPLERWPLLFLSVIRVHNETCMPS
jgi:adiponectin receptor